MFREPLTVGASLLVLLVYAVLLGVMPKAGFWSPDEGAKYIQTLSIGWDGGFDYRIPYPGVATDPGFEFYPARCRHEDLYPAPVDNKVRFHWPIWFPLASRVSLALFGMPGLYLIPVISGWLIAVLAGLLVRYHDPRLSPTTILLVGFATPILFYSLTFWEHTMAALLGIGALCILVASGPLRLSALLLMAPLLLGAVVLRIEMLAFAIALVLAWLISGIVADTGHGQTTLHRGGPRRWLLTATLVVVVIAVAVVALESVTWRHRWLFTVLPEYLLRNFTKLPFLPEIFVSMLISSPGHQGPVISLDWKFAALLAFAAAAVAAFLRARVLEAIIILPALLVILQFSLFVAFLPQSYLSLHGLLPVAPYIVVALYAVPYAWRERRFALLAVANAGILYLALAFAVMLTFAVNPDGTYRTGLEWGFRNMLPLYPIAAVLAVIALQVYRRSGRQVLVENVFAVLLVALMAVGVLFEVRGLRMLFGSRQLVAEWEKALPANQPVVTDIWWLPAVMAPFFTTHEMHCVRWAEEISEWLPAAAANGVDAFTFARFGPIDPDRVNAAGVDVTEDQHQTVSGLYLSRFRIQDAQPRAEP